MLDAAGARGPVADSPAPRDNPLVDLPANAGESLAGLTGVIVTHLHADHLDDEGARFLAANGTTTFGQSGDLAALETRGLRELAEIGSRALGEVQVHRTNGRHGVGSVADRMGPVSGVVLEHGDERIYVAGDTVRCSEVDESMRRHAPTTVVLNAGGARFREGDPITMSAHDVVAFASEHASATVIAVHMDAINHCLDTRDVLRAELHRASVTNVLLPDDGQRIALDRP